MIWLCDCKEKLDVDHLGFKGFICILGVILEQLLGYISMQVLFFSCITVVVVQALCNS